MGPPSLLIRRVIFSTGWQHKMGRSKKHSDNRADLRGAGFIGLPVVVHASAAYRSLGVFERAVLTEILAAFNGYNNGSIVVSQRQIADALGNGNFRKIGRAIAVLIERGLLDIATHSVWKQRLAREYRLTFITSESPPYTRPASNEYLAWRKTTLTTCQQEMPNLLTTYQQGRKSLLTTCQQGSLENRRNASCDQFRLLTTCHRL